MIFVVPLKSPVICSHAHFLISTYEWFHKALQSAFRTEIKAEVKVLFATRYKGREFEFATLLHTGMCCGDRVDGGDLPGVARLGARFSVDDDGPASSDGPVLEQATWTLLPQCASWSFQA